MSSNKTELGIEELVASSNPLDAVPDEMPFDVPYGPPISLDRAQAVIHAAVAGGQEAWVEDERSNSRFRG
jgi:hypothetical protein